jgi:DNA-binding CsgD family transcriptional regulator
MRLGEVIDSKNAQEALRARELELEEKARQLEELNTALKVLLEHRNEEKYQLQKDILSNIEKLVYPYLDRLYETRLDWKQKALVGIIKSNLGNLSLPFANQLNSRTLNLTPAELRIADLIRNGKTTKEIAQLLGLSYDTICCHRRNIRSKLGLIKRRINLRSYLLSIGRNQDMERASP